MSSNLNPLQASWALLDLLEGRAVSADPLRELAHRLDEFMCSIRHVQIDDIASIESVDVKHSEEDELLLRQELGERFSMLGFYWIALSSIIQAGVEPKIGTGDAVDDLLDITRELREVQFLNENHGQSEALAGLRFRYRHHLRMHVLPLRCHLEDVIFEGAE
jgi:hypothetical protein